MLVELHVGERWPLVPQSVAGLLHKVFLNRHTLDRQLSLALSLIGVTDSRGLVLLHCDKSHALRVPEGIGLLYTLVIRDY